MSLTSNLNALTTIEHLKALEYEQRRTNQLLEILVEHQTGQPAPPPLPPERLRKRRR